MKTIEVRFFAAFRDQAGVSDASVDTDAATVAELFDELRTSHPSLERYPAMKYAVNDELVPADASVSDGDQVLFFPPVAGG